MKGKDRFIMYVYSNEVGDRVSIPAIRNSKNQAGRLTSLWRHTFHRKVHVPLQYLWGGDLKVFLFPFFGTSLQEEWRC